MPPAGRVRAATGGVLDFTGQVGARPDTAAWQNKGRSGRTGAKAGKTARQGGYGMTQEETLKFEEGGNVEIQLRAVTTTGAALASNIVALPVERILLGGVIT